MPRPRPIRVTALRRLRPPAPSASADYRRRARQFRARHGDDPAQLHRSLRKLADEVNERQGNPASTPSYLPQNDSAEMFAAMVHEALDGGILRYTQRLRLLKAAASMGIGRFDANLIIATVQHRFGQPPAAEPTADSTPRQGWLPLLLVFLCIQGLILTGLGLLFWM